MLSDGEGHITVDALASPSADPTRSETLCMCGSSLNGNREIPSLLTLRWWSVGRVGKTKVASR